MSDRWSEIAKKAFRRDVEIQLRQATEARDAAIIRGDGWLELFFDAQVREAEYYLNGWGE